MVYWKIIEDLIVKKSFLITILLLSSYSCNLFAFEFPKFKCYTDKENEYLLGNVKKVVLTSDNGIICEYDFNRRGNYSNISINNYTSSEYPFQKIYYRTFCEGYFVNNYFYNFFLVGLRHQDYHVPFWLGYLGARRNLSFNYDNKGYLIEIVTKEFNGRSDEYKFSYDNSGNLITRFCNGLPMMKIQWLGKNMCGFYEYNKEGQARSEYDIKYSNLTCKITNLRDKSQTAIIYLNNNGKVERYFKSSGVGTSSYSQNTISCFYNSKGLLEKLIDEFKNRDQIVLTTTSFLYDVYNNVIEYKEIKKSRSTRQTQWNNTSTTTHYKYSYTYDEVGNWTSRITYSVKQGDIEVKHKECTETRVITYYDGIAASPNLPESAKHGVSNSQNKSSENTNNAPSEVCWYVYGSRGELQQEKIISGNSVNLKSLNKDYFTKILSNERKTIKLYSKVAEVISSHPSNSYNLSVDNNGYYQLSIIDPQSFWSKSKYLVIVNSK